MEPITTFLTTTIAGNIIVAAMGDVTLEKAASFWNEINIGNHDLQKAFSEAYKHSFATIEIVLTSREGLIGLFDKIKPKAKREKELAEDFKEKILNPFLEKKGLSGKNQEDFFKAGKKACQFFLKKQNTVLKFEELLREVRKKKNINPSLMNEEARETFHFIESILFTGHDLSEAPNIEKIRNNAEEVFLKRLESIGEDEVKSYFSSAGLSESLFYDLLKEKNLFMNGLAFNLDLAIKNNQKIANILDSYRSQEAKKEIEKNRLEKIKEREELLGKIKNLEQGMEFMKQAGVDLSPINTQIINMQKEFEKIDILIKRSDEWAEAYKNINSQLSSYNDYLGDITEVLQEMGEKLDELIKGVRDIDEAVKDVSVTVKETRDVAVETKEAVLETSKDLAYIKELLLGFKNDTYLDIYQKESLIAGLDPREDFDLHNIYDFSESREYELGRGAVGVVYRAIRKGTNKPCALKILKEEYRKDHSVVTRFLREGVILKGLAHPNIIKVEDVGGGGKNLNFYIHMELVEGSTLRKLIDDKKLPGDWEKICSITKQILRGIDAIHKKTIIHRDINPNNIIINSDGTVKIMDFGVAKIVGLSGLTRHGEVVGTSRYMSPEQERGETLDYRSDIYSAGLVLYEIYTYRKPEKPLKSVKFYNPSIPEWVDLIFPNCLTQDKEKRYPSIEKLIKIIDGEGADPLEIKKYKQQFDVFLEDGKITIKKENVLKELKKELNIPESIYKKLEEEVKADVIKEKIQEGEEALRNGNHSLAERCYSVALLIDSKNAKARAGIEKIKNSKKHTEIFINMTSEEAVSKTKEIYIKPEMVLVPDGNFERKYTECKAVEKKDAGFFDRLLGNTTEKIEIEKSVTVQLSSFYIGKYPVTNKKYKLFKPDHEGSWSDPDYPVETVTWYDAVAYCNWLSDKEGFESCYSGSGDDIVCDFTKNGYRLPTEAEWEYACRAGTTTKYYWGNEMDGDYCWYQDNSGDQVNKVGQKKPNAWGLYDMSGNVWEWCWDWYDESYYSNSPSSNPTGPSTGSRRVFRGGSFFNGAVYCRSANRHLGGPDDCYDSLGFRLSRTP